MDSRQYQLGEALHLSAEERLIIQDYMDKIRRGLLNPETNTKQIADRLGFQYPQHFVRFFKKHVGSTQREYRLQMN